MVEQDVVRLSFEQDVVRHSFEQDVAELYLF